MVILLRGVGLVIDLFISMSAGHPQLVMTGIGICVGYVLWVRGRLEAIRCGKAFHMGSAIKTLIITGVVAFALGIAFIFDSAEPADDASFRTAMLIFLVGLAVGIVVMAVQWQAAREAGTTRALPTLKELGKEIVDSVMNKQEL